MKRALVTGGLGFLGSHVADALTEAGWAVRVFDRGTSTEPPAGIDLIQGELTDEGALKSAVTDCQVVFHLAGLSDLRAGHGAALQSVEDNVRGTVQLLELCRQTGVDRFVFASSVYVYSRAGGFYRTSKQACENYIEEFQRQHGLAYTILRYGSLYGPRANESNGVYRLLRQALAEGSIRHEGHPTDTREYVHVRDAARLSVQALAPEFANAHLTISGQHPTQIQDLFTMFSEMLGQELSVDYVEPSEASAHYRITPYAYTPRSGQRLTDRTYVDMGQGLLELLDQMRSEAAPSDRGTVGSTTRSAS